MIMERGKRINIAFGEFPELLEAISGSPSIVKPEKTLYGFVRAPHGVDEKTFGSLFYNVKPKSSVMANIATEYGALSIPSESEEYERIFVFPDMSSLQSANQHDPSEIYIPSSFYKNGGSDFDFAKDVVEQPTFRSVMLNSFGVNARTLFDSLVDNVMKNDQFEKAVKLQAELDSIIVRSTLFRRSKTAKLINRQFAFLDTVESVIGFAIEKSSVYAKLAGTIGNENVEASVSPVKIESDEIKMTDFFIELPISFKIELEKKVSVFGLMCLIFASDLSSEFGSAEVDFQKNGKTIVKAVGVEGYLRKVYC